MIFTDRQRLVITLTIRTTRTDGQVSFTSRCNSSVLDNPNYFSVKLIIAVYFPRSSLANHFPYTAFIILSSLCDLYNSSSCVLCAAFLVPLLSDHFNEHTSFSFYQLLVVTKLHRPATVHDQNLVAVSDGVQSVRHCYHSAFLELVAHCAL